MFTLDQHTIFLTLAGSQAHGTARDGSDVDLRGVCVAPMPTRLSLFEQFEQYEGALPDGLAETVLPRLREHATASRALGVKVECVIFDAAKFVGLCAVANPNALEILFADERDWVLATAPWRRLHARRHGFLTGKIQHTFLGYAMAQLKKIRTHRSWLLEPPHQKPTRQDFGALSSQAVLSRDDQERIERSLTDRLRSYGIDDVEMPKPARMELEERLNAFYRDVLAAASQDEREDRLRTIAAHALTLPANIVAAINAEKRYRAALKHWESYQTWLRHRNPARAALEQAYGYDTKHAMHLIRIMRMGYEGLSTGELCVRRDDADELLAIRDGAMPFEELLATATRLQEDIAQVAAVTTLPADIDKAEVDALLASLLLA
jgi:predicted nucleotidyltransferase